MGAAARLGGSGAPGGSPRPPPETGHRPAVPEEANRDHDPTARLSHPPARRPPGGGAAAAGCQPLSNQSAPGRAVASVGSLCRRAHGSGLEAGGAVCDQARASTAEGRERGVLEQAGRILRARATRKQLFHTILPLLTAGLIRPADGKRPAKKDERLIREQVRTLRAEQQEAGEEADAYVAMTNLIEQACNY